MTLAIALTNPEGIVIAAESRQTYTIAGHPRVGSDSVRKVFELNPRIIAATSGWGLLRPQGSPAARHIASLVDDFKSNLAGETTVQVAAQALHDHFQALFDWHIANSPNDQTPAGGAAALMFFVAGYDEGSRVGQLYQVDVPGTVVFAGDRNNPGTRWIGQWDVVGRIINGYDTRLKTLAFYTANAVAIEPQLNGLGYVVQWGIMTLQDAIDFARSMVEVTITVQRFTHGILSAPGDFPGVGGPIDVAIVRPGESEVLWVAQKKLHI